jgi:hypothetical protein
MLEIRNSGPDIGRRRRRFFLGRAKKQRKDLERVSRQKKKIKAAKKEK